jgi:hypothetical protein
VGADAQFGGFCCLDFAGEAKTPPNNRAVPYDLRVKTNRLWGSQQTTIVALVCIALLSGLASAFARRSGLPGGLRLGTGWFFHVAFGVFVFVVLYSLAALLTVTVRAGGPPTKMSGLGFSWDWEKAVEIANSGAESLEELNKRLSGMQEQVAALIGAERETQEALIAIADAIPTAPSALRADALMRSQRLGRLLERTEGSDDRASEAIAGFRANLAEIERLHEEMTRA